MEKQIETRLLKKLVNEVLARQGLGPVKSFAKDFADGSTFKLAPLAGSSSICRSVLSPLQYSVQWFGRLQVE